MMVIVLCGGEFAVVLSLRNVRLEGFGVEVCGLLTRSKALLSHLAFQVALLQASNPVYALGIPLRKSVRGGYLARLLPPFL